MTRSVARSLCGLSATAELAVTFSRLPRTDEYNKPFEMSVRPCERRPVSAVSRSSKSYSSSTAGPTLTTLGMYIHASGDTTYTKQNFQFRRIRLAAPLTT